MPAGTVLIEQTGFHLIEESGPAMQTPLISVIIPVYNVEAYLPRCLDSVIQNTYRELEIICVDDGSTDGSPEILRDYAQRDARITVITKENGGVSSARNAGLDRMTGEFVTFIDSDDFVHPQHFELLRKVQILSGADIAVTQFQNVYDDQPVSEMTMHSIEIKDIELLDLHQAMKKKMTHSYCTVLLFPSRLVGDTRFRHGFSLGEDTIFCLEVFERSKAIKFGMVAACTYYYYRDRAESLVNSRTEKDVLKFFSYLVDKAAIKEKEAIYFETMFRRGRNLRYYYKYIQKNRWATARIDSLLRRRIPQLLRSNLFTAKNKLAWTIFALFPITYRMHKKRLNPSLKIEDMERKKRRL